MSMKSTSSTRRSTRRSVRTMRRPNKASQTRFSFGYRYLIIDHIKVSNKGKTLLFIKRISRRKNNQNMMVKLDVIKMSLEESFPKFIRLSCSVTMYVRMCIKRNVSRESKSVLTHFFLFHLCTKMYHHGNEENEDKTSKRILLLSEIKRTNTIVRFYFKSRETWHVMEI